MSEPFVFDPRCDLCKTPFGAVVCGTSVTFSCRPLLSERFDHCALVLHGDFSGEVQEIELSPVQTDGDRFRFTCTVDAPAEPELIWYHFRFWRNDGSGCVLDKSGYRSDGKLEPWQLTVYRESHTPQWFGAGMVYQIFPDRFFRTAVPDPAGMVGERTVHETWEDAPVWRPDERGIVRNSDFFGGNLAGVTEKLDDLAALGVTTVYFCPIFESASNHRYNTADYERIDPMLGTEEDLRTLCEQARQRGIRVILDGVFNHIGSQSKYFNEDGFYPSLGAAQSQESPYFQWFSFHPWPYDYDAWWGIKTLPAVREEHPAYVDYIIENENAIIRRWLRCGASGWRLDVADELPDWFIRKIRAAMEETDSDSLLIGEVWEDASTKIAYSQRRQYLLGSEVHGVMNYPFRSALLDYLKGGGAEHFCEAMETLRENYPPAAFHAAMNFLGTHDTARILTVLGADTVPGDKAQRAEFRLSPVQRQRGIALLKLAALVLFTFPGAPTVYYGDEAGMEGWEDPFNRGTYPWGREDHDLKATFALLAALRHSRPSLHTGSIRYLCARDSLLAFERQSAEERSVTVVNRSAESKPLSIPWNASAATDLLTGQTFCTCNGHLHLTLPPYGGLLLE
ncbi:MAG: glycoside hydrolase family 13 protein [Ruminococcaceae bacterium]|nr:glycoside hydrolase family 13 protein [Oscillospiraceae bacterium]